MNWSEREQLLVAVNIYKTEPDRLKSLYDSGRLHLCYVAMFVLYLHYTGGYTFEKIRTNYNWNDVEFIICDLFINGVQDDSTLIV